MRAARLPTLFAFLLTLLLLSAPHTRRVVAAPPADDCEGDACSQVTLTFDESKQQYLAQNNSADRWARITASNLAASASACLGPGKSGYLTLKSVVGPYRADYAEVRCGEQGPPDAPPAR